MFVSNRLQPFPFPGPVIWRVFPLAPSKEKCIISDKRKRSLPVSLLYSELLFWDINEEYRDFTVLRALINVQCSMIIHWKVIHSNSSHLLRIPTNNSIIRTIRRRASISSLRKKWKKNLTLWPGQFQTSFSSVSTIFSKNWITFLKASKYFLSFFCLSGDNSGYKLTNIWSEIIDGKNETKFL